MQYLSITWAIGLEQDRSRAKIRPKKPGGGGRGERVKSKYERERNGKRLRESHNQRPKKLKI